VCRRSPHRQADQGVRQVSQGPAGLKPFVGEPHLPSHPTDQLIEDAELVADAVSPWRGISRLEGISSNRRQDGQTAVPQAPALLPLQDRLKNGDAEALNAFGKPLRGLPSISRLLPSWPDRSGNSAER